MTYKIKDPKATLKIFSTGSITVTAPSVTNVQRAVEHIYPYVEEHAKTKVVADKTNPVPKSRLILLFVLCKFIILYILQSINIVLFITSCKLFTAGVKNFFFVKLNYYFYIT